MAVEIQYIVVRKGEEKMTFASKKEADAYDKMLDMAEVFSDWLAASPLDMEDQQNESLGLFMAENKDVLQQILRTGRLPDENAADKSDDVSESKLRAVAG
ncbi:YebG family protein [Erwinia pyrifoliae]|uniref:YebG family protein n=1 Tax=Erwinia pyrifoliae TaxID=79967 RepID=A0ABY5XCT8_ERWPY|nr:YebG family protein [Erwinia pyrifoliae]AUX72927.1 hypothetical protein CPI84_10810 [Erwinia pyrifoliae]MCA8876800.1 hypothetical protein [Erwinia pyrifoliae]MCT2386958.1 YebG family protein [Erwinia pyrifoliae]MCU8587443.1 YebG family protein [Erwinia pyrifoliae]UWS31290.1 YebG family protein [Erwinia pyrifoliae]